MFVFVCLFFSQKLHILIMHNYKHDAVKTWKMLLFDEYRQKHQNIK